MAKWNIYARACEEWQKSEEAPAANRHPIFNLMSYFLIPFDLFGLYLLPVQLFTSYYVVYLIVLNTVIMRYIVFCCVVGLFVLLVTYARV